ncbi:MAG TPA: DUF3048 domain-containing protein [Streptosporangiaceae bacterium]|jgi:hypothetical protein
MAATSGTPARGGTGTARRVTAAALGLMITSCGAPNVVGPGVRAASPAGPAGIASPAQTGPFAPLTGTPAPADVASRPAVALAIAGSHPTGLSQADVVYEEISSPIRYLAVYQSRQAASAGPVTGTRPADGMIVSVLHAAVGYSGGTTGFIDVLHHQHVTDMGTGTHPALYRDGAAGLTVDTARLRQRRASPPPALLPFRGEGLVTSRQLASSGTWRPASVRIDIPGQQPQRWRYDAASRCWQVTAGPPAGCVANLIIQTVPYKQVFLSHRTGVTVPSARVLGAGRAVVLSSTAVTSLSGQQGVAVHATWTKPGAGDLTNFTSPKGDPVEFAPGRTWVILVPPGTRAVTSGKSQG